LKQKKEARETKYFEEITGAKKKPDRTASRRKRVANSPKCGAQKPLSHAFYQNLNEKRTLTPQKRQEQERVFNELVPRAPRQLKGSFGMPPQMAPTQTLSPKTFRQVSQVSLSPKSNTEIF